MIPRIDAEALLNTRHSGHQEAVAGVERGAQDIGFFTIYNTPITATRVQEVIDIYRAFFLLPEDAKEAVNMARTGSNRGWGAAMSEQVDMNANPDFKQFFDSGFELQPDDPINALKLHTYAANQWPERPKAFKDLLEAYYRDARSFSLDLLNAVAATTGRGRDAFSGVFDKPMALLRGNYYPPRPSWAGKDDFGIATHTDYGCLTFLATDGTSGLEVRKRGGGWIPVSAPVGEFVINFGDMLQMWSGGAIKATPHRVIGGTEERLSVPLFFNPNHDADVSPAGSDEPILAGEYLASRFNETYVHLKKG